MTLREQSAARAAILLALLAPSCGGLRSLTGARSLLGQLGTRSGLSRAQLGRRAVDGPEAARAFADEGVNTATLAGDAWSLSLAHVNRGELARLEGRDDDALPHYARALELSRPTGDRFLMAVALINAANVHLKRGDPAAARAMLTESLELYRGLWEEWGTAYCLVAFGGLAIAEGDMPRGATLLAAAETWFRGMGLRIEPTDREAYDRYLAAARGALDEASFAEAWRQGQTLSLAQAISLAESGT